MYAKPLTAMAERKTRGVYKIVYAKVFSLSSSFKSEKSEKNSDTCLTLQVNRGHITYRTLCRLLCARGWLTYHNVTERTRTLSPQSSQWLNYRQWQIARPGRHAHATKSVAWWSPGLPDQFEDRCISSWCPGGYSVPHVYQYFHFNLFTKLSCTLIQTEEFYPKAEWCIAECLDIILQNWFWAFAAKWNVLRSGAGLFQSGCVIS